MRRIDFFVIVILYIFTMLLTSTSIAQEPAGLRPDAPTYAVRGPYAVGARDFVIEGDAPVHITVWYPALNPSKANEEITYVISDDHPDFPGMQVTGHAIQDAAVDLAKGPYPLVVYGPGLAGWRQFSVFMPEHWASQGIVTIAFDPRGETFESYWEGAVTRPLDIQRIIAYADTLTAQGGELAGLIDTEHVAVAGHSSGGWGALAGGGAQYDLSWCAANAELVATYDLSNCHQFVPHQEDIAVQFGLDEAPQGLWPAKYDARVDAVITLAPDGDIWGADYTGLANVEVPTMVMYGSEDDMVFAKPIYEHLGTVEKSQVIFEGADHMIFANTCEAAPWFAEVTYWVCSDAVWDMDRAHDLINHFTTAFLLAELKDDTEAATALAAENVDFHGISYETTAY